MKIYLFSISLILATSSLFANSWKKTVSKDGVNVYKRTVKGSPVIELKGTAIVNHSIKDILAVVLDYKNFKKWQPNLITFRRVKVISTREFINYAAFKLPWPISNRDVVMHTKIMSKGSNKVQVNMRETTHPSRPKSNKYVRIKMARVQWNLQSINAGKSTKLQFISRGDPGGYIPLWLINWVGKYQVVEGINRLRKRVKQNKHDLSVLKNYRLNHIK